MFDKKTFVPPLQGAGFVGRKGWARMAESLVLTEFTVFGIMLCKIIKYFTLVLDKR